MTTQAEAISSLQDMGPGGICGDCGHFALRHHFPPDEGEDPCPCDGMLWQGQRLEMDYRSGPIPVGQPLEGSLGGSGFFRRPLRIEPL